MNKIIAGLVFALLLGLIQAAPASVINIDTFDDGEQIIVGGMSDEIETSAAIGGYRYFEVTGKATRVRAEINTEDYPGECTYSSDVNYAGSLTLKYGTQSNFDLGDPIGRLFRIEVLTLDGGSGTDGNTLKIEVVTSTQSDSYTIDWPSSSGYLDILYSNFDGITDWSDVDTLSFTFTGQKNADIGIGYIKSIPEPAISSLLLAGGVASLIKRRRQK